MVDVGIRTTKPGGLWPPFSPARCLLAKTIFVLAQRSNPSRGTAHPSPLGFRLVYNTLMQDEQPVGVQPESNWQFNSEGGQVIGPAPNNAGTNSDDEAISWTASEFIEHDKGFGWFALLGVGAALMMLVTYLLTRDVVSTIIMLVVTICFGTFAVRKPRTLPYRLDDTGLHIDKRTYHYSQFKSFSLVQDGGIRSIQLTPLKRMLPPLNIYMDPTDEDRIVDALADYLPLEPHQPEMIDRLMRRLRF